MGLMVTYRENEGTGEPMVRLTRRMWLTEDKSEVVEDGDERAATLLGAEGDEISRAEAERLGMLGDETSEGRRQEGSPAYEQQVDAHSGMASPHVDPSEVAEPGPGQGDSPSPIPEAIAGHDITLGDEVVPELAAAEEARARAIEESGQADESASSAPDADADPGAPEVEGEGDETAESADDEAKQADAPANKRARRGGSK